MRADREDFLNSIQHYDRSDLLLLAISFYDELEELKLQRNENEKINTEVHIQFCELKKDYDSLWGETETLKNLLAKEIDKNSLRARSTFGRKSEQLISLIDATDNRINEIEDESLLEENDAAAYERKSRITDFSGHRKSKRNSSSSGRHRNSLAASLKTLPQQIYYNLDVEGLNEQYGAYGWRIAFWHSHSTLEKLPTPYYTKTVYTPVISSGLEHMLTTIPYQNPLVDKSAVSPSAMADILYRKFVLSLPFYRQAMDFRMQGIELIKQTIINWVNGLVPDILGVVRDYMMECLVKYRYAQSDETYIQVNKDGRGPGHKSFMWVHCSSELLDCNPIIIFCYEQTRNTDHLRSFFGEFMGYITCDAYVSYKVLEAESDGDIVTTGCFMHCRRYFAEAFFVQDVTSLSDEELMALPETNALMRIRDIYHEENALGKRNANARGDARTQKVAPKVDVFFDYVHSLKTSQDVFSDRMKKAINYAINQEQNLRRFLMDGNIPCDNGHVERVIRSYSVGRANWLFADTVYGAEVNAIVYSITETAKANQVNVGCYLQYLFEEVPKYLEQPGRGLLPDMMPWSLAYKKYEENKRQADLALLTHLFPEPSRPKTPRKRDLIAQLPPALDSTENSSAILPA